MVFYGSNGQGKTNLIESLYVLIRGESFRPASFATMETQDGRSEPMSISASVTRSGLQNDLALTWADGKKTSRWNHRKIAVSSLAKEFPVVHFSPESLAAIKSGPEQRRRLLDDLITTHTAGSFKVYKDFRKILRARNKVLKDLRDQVRPERENLLVLESLDPNYLPLAAELTFARIQALRDLQEDFNRTSKFVLNDESVDISVEYLISSQPAQDWSRGDVLSALHKRSQELRRAEIQAGTSLVGPQKHDIRVLFSGKDSRFFCSQGQQRALILSFKMAQILYHYKAHKIYPLMLLDDVLSELDPIRRGSLVSFLKDIPAQIFLTTTDLSFSRDFGDLRMSVFRVNEGNVSPD